MKRARKTANPLGDIDPLRARHLDLATKEIGGIDGAVRVLINESESPLAWLASRKGRDGRAMISHEQFIAGERLRADFTKAHLMPRVTSNWSMPSGKGGAGGHADPTDIMVAARQRVRIAIEACGPEFSGLLMDVCCFLRGLEDIERERGWPQRSGKVVLQLGLERLARHYGLASELRGRGAKVRAWAG